MKILFSIIYIIFILSTIFSCQNSVEYDFERTKISINKQKFEILTAWKIFDDYIVNKSNYEDNIFLKIKEEFDNNNSEYAFLLDAIKNEIKPDEELKKEIELMKSINFVSIVDSVYQIVTKKLPGPDIKILFIPTNPANRKFYRDFGVGFHAFTLGAGKIIVSLDPTFENWRQYIQYALAHEYHHSVWTSRNFETPDLTPLEYIILEGKADLFAKGIIPESNNPFWDMLDNENENRIWNIIKPKMNQRNTDINEKIFYGSKEIPYGSVYAIGYSILKLFKANNPNIDDAEIIDMPPEEILYLSKYDE
ncbi:MAG: hypothetical protein KGZ85_07425 [Ignavibacterium sp.]|nr:hypothetical protein [Ignavibacterium sp.]